MSLTFLLQRGKSTLFLAALVALTLFAGATHAFAANQLSVSLAEPDPVESKSVHFSIVGNDDIMVGGNKKLFITSRAAGEPCGPSYQSEIAKGATSETFDFNYDGAFSTTEYMTSRSTNGTYVMCAWLQAGAFDATAAVAASAVVTTRPQKASLTITTAGAVLKDSNGKYTGAVRVSSTGLLELASRTLYVKVKRPGEPDCGPSLPEDQLGFNLGDSFIISGAFTDRIIAGSGATPGKTYKICVWLQNGTADTGPDATASADVTIPNAPPVEDSQACKDARGILAAKQKALASAKKTLTTLRKKAKKARGKKAKKKAAKRVRAQQKKVTAAQAAVKKAQASVDTLCKK